MTVNVVTFSGVACTDFKCCFQSAAHCSANDTFMSNRSCCVVIRPSQRNRFPDKMKTEQKLAESLCGSSASIFTTSGLTYWSIQQDNIVVQFRNTSEEDRYREPLNYAGRNASCPGGIRRKSGIALLTRNIYSDHNLSIHQGWKDWCSIKIEENIVNKKRAKSHEEENSGTSTYHS